MTQLSDEILEIIKSGEVKEYLSQTSNLKGAPFAHVLIAFMCWFEKQIATELAIGDTDAKTNGYYSGRKD